MNNKRIVIAGGSGFLGRNLKRFLESDGYEVKVLTRQPKGTDDIQWDAKTLQDWRQELEGSAALINLAGKSVDCRYNEHNKAEILDSRIESTRVLHEAVAKCHQAPRVWLNSSTSTIYKDTRGELPANIESSNNIGDDFSMGVAKAWEQEFFGTDQPATIQTAMRIAIVMGNDGGAFPVMSKSKVSLRLCHPEPRHEVKGLRQSTRDSSVASSLRMTTG